MLIGIFFIVNGELIVDAVQLEHGEEYGNAIQHGGHYEFWENLEPKTKSERIFKRRAYDAFPRGRVIFDVRQGRPVIYVDRCIKDERSLALLKHAFQLSGFDVRTDEHYQCARCNQDFID